MLLWDTKQSIFIINRFPGKRAPNLEVEIKMVIQLKEIVNILNYHYVSRDRVPTSPAHLRTAHPPPFPRVVRLRLLPVPKNCPRSRPKPILNVASGCASCLNLVGFLPLQTDKECEIDRPIQRS